MLLQSVRKAAGIAGDLWTYPCFDCGHCGAEFCKFRAGKCTSSGVQYRGAYSSFAEATKALPQEQPQGFDSANVVETFLENLTKFNPADYPVLLRLLQAVTPGHTIFDLGGGFGQCYYAYQQHIQFPHGHRWVVCDVPAFTHHGEQIAQQKQLDTISFTNERKDADGCDLYLSNGTLQYLEPDLFELLSELKSKPRHVLINRVPAYGGETFYTIQRGIGTRGSYAVYKVMNIERFIGNMEKIGYRKVDHWSVPRELRIPFHPEYYVSAYQGFYFALSAA